MSRIKMEKLFKEGIYSVTILYCLKNKFSAGSLHQILQGKIYYLIKSLKHEVRFRPVQFLYSEH